MLKKPDPRQGERGHSHSSIITLVKTEKLEKGGRGGKKPPLKNPVREKGRVRATPFFFFGFQTKKKKIGGPNLFLLKTGGGGLPGKKVAPGKTVRRDQ